MEFKLILAILLVGILIFSLAQAFEINNLKTKVGGGTSIARSISEKASSAYGAVAPATSPTMVGGC